MDSVVVLSLLLIADRALEQFKPAKRLYVPPHPTKTSTDTLLGLYFIAKPSFGIYVHNIIQKHEKADATPNPLYPKRRLA